MLFYWIVHWRKEKQIKTRLRWKVALKVSNEASYKEVYEMGIEKWKAYHSNEFSKSEKYTLVDQDGQVLFLPGTNEFFSLKRYKWERLQKNIK